MINVINKKNEHKYNNVIYVGRGSPLGNPFTSIHGRKTLAKFVVNSREESIESYRKYLISEIEKNNRVVCGQLNRIYSEAIKKDVQLSCFCSPKSCHADVIKEIIESKIKPNIENNLKEVQLNIFNKD